MDYKERLIEMFTDDPINWLKWAVVLAAFAAGFFIDFKLEKLLATILKDKEYKKKIALERGNVIRAAIISETRTERVSGDIIATYKYTLDGMEKKYTVRFKYPNGAPRILHLYYLNDPRKFFCVDTGYSGQWKALILFPLRFLPFILAALIGILIKVKSNM